MKIVRTVLYSILFLIGTITAMDDSQDLHNPESLLVLASRAVIQNPSLWDQINKLPFNDIESGIDQKISSLPKIDQCFSQNIAAFSEKNNYENVLKVFCLATKLYSVDNSILKNYEGSFTHSFFPTRKEKLSFFNPSDSSFVYSVDDINNEGFKKFLKREKKALKFVYNPDASKAIVLFEGCRNAQLYDIEKNTAQVLKHPLNARDSSYFHSVHSASWNPFNKNQFLLGASYGYVLVWDFDSKDKDKAKFVSCFNVDGHGSFVQLIMNGDRYLRYIDSIACDPFNEDRVATPCLGGISIYSISTGKQLQKIEIPITRVACQLSFDPKIKNLLWCSESKLYACILLTDETNLFFPLNDFNGLDTVSLSINPEVSNQFVMQMMNYNNKPYVLKLFTIQSKFLNFMSLLANKNQYEETNQDVRNTELCSDISQKVINSSSVYNRFSSLFTQDRMIMAMPLLFLAFMRR